MLISLWVIDSAKAKLVKERESLVQTSKKLARDLAKVTAATPILAFYCHSYSV